MIIRNHQNWNSNYDCCLSMIQTYLAHWFIFSSKVITQILPLLQKSKKCCCHYSTILHVTINTSSLIKKKVWPFIWFYHIWIPLPKNVLWHVCLTMNKSFLRRKMKMWKVYDDNKQQLSIRKSKIILYLRWAKIEHKSVHIISWVQLGGRVHFLHLHRRAQINTDPPPIHPGSLPRYLFCVLYHIIPLVLLFWQC